MSYPLPEFSYGGIGGGARKLQERPREGLVTQNYKTPAFLSKARKDPQIPASQRLGAVVDTAALNIRPNEMLFTKRHGLLPTNAEFAVDPRISAFSSFNGYPIRPAGKGQDAFEDEFNFAGYARAEFKEDDLSQPETGVASQIRGSLQVWNNGNKPILPGQLIKWRLRKIDEKERKLDDAELNRIAARFDGNYPGKYVGILEPYERASFDLPTRSMNWVFGKLEGLEGVAEGAPDRPLTSTPAIFPLPAAHLSAEENFGISLWRTGGTQCVLGLMGMAASPPRPPEADGWVEIVPGLRLNRQQFMANGASQLAAMLGVVRGETPTNRAMITSVLKHQYVELLKTVAAQDQIVGNPDALQAPPMNGTMRSLAMTYLSTYFGTLEHFIERERRKVIGRALEGAQPGDSLDILLY